MTKRTFIVNNDDYDLGQIYQNDDLYFSFLNEHKVKGRMRLYQQHQFVKCRDFLNDCLTFSHFEMESPRMYGFTFHGDTDPIRFDKVSMVLRIGQFSKDKIKRIKPILNGFENQWKWDLTTIREIVPADKSNDCYRYYQLEADKRWLYNTIYFSLFTHFVRSSYQYGHHHSNYRSMIDGYNHQNGSVGDYNADLSQNFTSKHWEVLFGKQSELISKVDPCGYDVTAVYECDAEEFHNHLGFVSWIGSGFSGVEYAEDYEEEGDANGDQKIIHEEFSTKFNKLMRES